MRTKFNLTLTTMLFATLFSCQKEVSQNQKTDAAVAIESTSEDQNVSLIINPTDKCGTVHITGGVSGKSGELTLFINNEPSGATQSAKTDIDQEVTLTGGLTYQIRLQWRNPNSNAVRSTTIPYQVPACETIVATCIPQLFSSKVETLGANRFKVTYTVKTCDDSYKAVKLQGGLTANTINSSIISTTSDNAKEATYSNTLDKFKKNTTHTWLFDIDAHTTKTFSLEFDVDPRKTFSGATINGNEYPITGAWSLKQNSILLGEYLGRVSVSK